MSATAATGPTDMSENPTPTDPDPAASPPARSSAPPPTPSGRLTWLAYLTRGGLAVLAIIVGGSILALMASSKAPPARSNLGESFLKVRTLEVSQREVARVWEGFGTARAMSAANVRAEVGGLVIERSDEIEAGSAISEGDTIIKIEPMDYQQRVTASEKRVDALQAQLSGLEIEEQRLREQEKLAEQEQETALRDLQRVRDAVSRGAGSPGEVDQAEAAQLRAQRTLAGIRQQVGLIPSRRAALEAQLLGEQATLRVERENLVRTVVTSPIDGVLQAIDFERGEWVGASQRVARVVDLTRVEIPLRLPKSSSGSVRVGNRVELRSDSASSQTWSGTISRIAPEVDAGTRTLEAFVEVVQQPGSLDTPLLPGQFVVGRVWTDATDERVVLPRRAVVADRVLLGEPVREGDASIEGVEDTRGLLRVRPAPVRVDYHLGGALRGRDASERDWAVLERAGALPDGSVVILSNLDQLVEGMIVRLVEQADETARGSD